MRPEGYWVHPLYVNDGMVVCVPWGNNGSGLRCRVQTAAGYHARVVNEKYRVDRWVHIDSLLVHPDIRAEQQRAFASANRLDAT